VSYLKLIVNRINTNTHIRMNTITLCQINSCQLIGSYANRRNPSKLYCSDHRLLNMKLVSPNHLENLAVAHGLIKRPTYKCKCKRVTNNAHPYHTYQPMRIYDNETHPDMTIYEDIQFGYFYPIYWKQLARATPLFAYLRK
jgi:hypothetical protein